MKKTISIFFPLFFALCTFCESANADVRIGLPRVTVPISPRTYHRSASTWILLL